MAFSSRTRAIVLAWIALSVAAGCLSAQLARDYAIEVTAFVQESPPRIALNWRPNPDTRQTVVSRKLKNSSNWTQLAVLPASRTNWVDTNISVGVGYEYALTKTPTSFTAPTGYIYAGIKLPVVDHRGKILLLVENTYETELAVPIWRLERDLIADGWTVIRRSVNRTQTPPQVRSIIQNVYYSDPANVKAVLLLGRVPVPMSGNYEADDHPEHKGAWSADTYYADVNGTWTDSSVRITTAVREQNRNVPGDGKFDQSLIPSDLELEVGRIDMARLPSFAPKTEKDLLAQYLDKNHRYRNGKIAVQRRAILYDGFGGGDGEADAASGWRNFAPFYGPQGTVEVSANQFFPTTTTQSFLWTYICGPGGGDYDNVYGVGNVADWARSAPRTVFAMMFGSYFGDWDSDNNFMRAGLASSGYVLAAAWAGRPHWFFHHMALGETIGYSTRLTQNNNGRYMPNHFGRLVHISLMGDPTLRMHVVPPPSSLTANSTANGATTLNWNASPDALVLGYHVYRSASLKGPFTRLTSNLVAGNSFTDFSAKTATTAYMVRAIKLESSRSGTYYNASQGILSTLQTNATPRAGEVVVQDANSNATAASLTGDTLVQQANLGNASGWILKGAADFNGDRQADLLWNGTDGRISVWHMQNNTRQSTSILPSPGGTWRVAGVADFNRDNQGDVLLQNADGLLVLWYMNGTRPVQASTLRTPAAGWRVVAATDWNRDVQPDILFQHIDGRLAVWMMNGTTVWHGLGLPRPPADYTIIGFHDFNSDGNPDIIFRNPQGALIVWYMQGNSRLGALNLRTTGQTAANVIVPMNPK